MFFTLLNQVERAPSEALLYNLLPTEIASHLKDAPGKTIAGNLDQTALLFAGIVDFTPRSARMTPEELVSFLNHISSTFRQTRREIRDEGDQEHR